MRQFILALAAASAAATLLGVASSSAATPKWYWSEEKAEALAATKVRIPYCFIFTTDAACQNGAYNERGLPRIGSYPLTEVVCTGSDEKGETFTFARFRCRFTAGLTDRDYAAGRVLLYPSGASKLRWKLSSLARLS